MEFLVTVRQPHVNNIELTIDEGNSRKLNAEVTMGICRADSAEQACKIAAARVNVPAEILTAEPVPQNPLTIHKVQVVSRISDGETAHQDVSTGLCITTGTPESAREMAKNYMRDKLAKTNKLRYVEIIDTSLDTMPEIDMSELPYMAFVLTA